MTPSSKNTKMMYNGLTNRWLKYREIPKEEVIASGVDIEATNVIHICANGKIIHPNWIYDNLTTEGNYYYFDFTEYISEVLFDRISFAKDLRLKDIFHLVQNNIDFLEPVIKNYCREYCQVGLTDIQLYDPTYSDENIEYLELYKFVEITRDYEFPESEKLCIESVDQLHFHGIGHELQSDTNHHLKGSRINWSISYNKVNELSDTPIIINRDTMFYDNNFDKDGPKVYKGENPKLIDVIHAIFFELSWDGDPTKK